MRSTVSGQRCWQAFALLMVLEVAADNGHDHSQFALDQFEADLFLRYGSPVARSLLPASQNATVRRGCGNANPLVRVSAAQSKTAQHDRASALVDVPIKIGTYFHIITDSAGNGAVQNDQLSRQVDVLNRAYRVNAMNGTLWNYSLQATYRWTSDTAYNGGLCEKDNAETKSRIAFFRNRTNSGQVTMASLVVIITSLKSCGGADGLSYLGYASFPWEADEADAVVIDSDTVPGGSLKAFQLGHTLVHEVGHWLGLYHTFSDGTCSVDNDEVHDTPISAKASYGCPKGVDSCPSQPSKDQVQNFMDYTDDVCMDRFSKGQQQRMLDMFTIYRVS